MKEATGEMNMTVVTIIAIGAILAFFWIMWPRIRGSIEGVWSNVNEGTSSEEVKCSNGFYWDGHACQKAG